MVMTQGVLENRLLAAANCLRGPIDPADFKNYVFPMLFWKWLSDKWQWEHDQAVADFGEDVDPEVEDDYHQFAIPDGALWGQVTTRPTNIGVAINKAMGRIEQTNPDRLAGIFGDAVWGNKDRLPEPNLVNLIGVLDGMTLSPDHVSNDLLGAAYEYLLRDFADSSGQKAGEFFTPRSVVRLLVDVLNPQQEESVYDPACGSGGMLVETINAVRGHGGDVRTLHLYGQEVNLTTSGIARMNLLLHDIGTYEIVRGDTLRNPGLKRPDGHVRQFDVVIANPPFSLKNWGHEVWPADPRAFCGIPPKTNADMAWIQHMVTSMNPEGGRVGVVMPHGVLFRGGAETKIRRCLVADDRLEAVIGLPPNLFYSTSIPACILVFQSQKPPGRKGHVLFVDGAARFTKAKNRNELMPDDIAAILAAYETGEDTDCEGGVAVRLVPQSEIEGKAWDLSLNTYISSAATDEVDLATALAAYLEARENRIGTEQALFVRLTAAGLADLGDKDE